METLASGLREALRKLRKAPIVDSKTLNAFIRDVQRTLLRADVSVELVMEISEKIKERVRKAQLPPGFSKKELLYRILYEELVQLLGGENAGKPPMPTKKPYVIMLVGIQGAGKTTSAGKLAYFYKKKGFKPCLVCADNYRPAACIQLSQLASQIGVTCIVPENTESTVSMAVQGIKEAHNHCDIVIIDTAGRHKQEEGLIKEMKELYHAIKPDHVILVLDASMGSQAEKHALAFHKAAPLGSIMITKLDGSAKGGGALAAAAKTGARISFVGVGEKIDEIEEFDPKAFVARLLGMGDIKSLIEKFEAFERIEKERLKAISAGKLTLYDLREQLQAINRMGPLSRILEMIPGGAKLAGTEEMAKENIKKWLAIMDSMTKEELLKPEIIDKSRIARIARGSGTTPQDVRRLLSSYRKMRKMYKQLLRQQKRLKRGAGFPIG